jgi:hypothetical protein
MNTPTKIPIDRQRACALDQKKQKPEEHAQICAGFARRSPEALVKQHRDFGGRNCD